MKGLIIKTIKIYQKFVAPYQGTLFPAGLLAGCRFYPSCSNYTAQAVERYGSLRGLAMGLKRVLKCQPLASGGVDLP